MTTDRRTLAVRATGRVQGVNYRHFTREAARRLGVSGWVVNLDDGSVAAAFHGTGGALGQLLELCRKGPPAAEVASLDVRSADRLYAEEPPRDAYTFRPEGGP